MEEGKERKKGEGERGWMEVGANRRDMGDWDGSPRRRHADEGRVQPRRHDADIGRGRRSQEVGGGSSRVVEHVRHGRRARPEGGDASASCIVDTRGRPGWELDSLLKDPGGQPCGERRRSGEAEEEEAGAAGSGGVGRVSCSRRERGCVVGSTIGRGGGSQRRAGGVAGFMAAAAALLLLSGGAGGGGATAQQVTAPGMPIWAAGDNRYGTLGVSAGLGTSTTNNVPIQNSGDAWAGSEVVWLSSRWRHTFVQTANKSLVTTASVLSYEEIPASLNRSTYAWGWNRYGQLGSKAGVGTDNGQLPFVLPRSLFPKAESGNEISSRNRNVTTYRLEGGSRVACNLLLDTGLMDAASFVDQVMSKGNALCGHSKTWLTARVEGDQNVLSVVEGGYQLDLTGTSGPRECLGFLPVKVPSDGLGTLGEISSALGNNKISYAYQVNGQWVNKTLLLPVGTYQAVNTLNLQVWPQFRALHPKPHTPSPKS